MAKSGEIFLIGIYPTRIVYSKGKGEATAYRLYCIPTPLLPYQLPAFCLKMKVSAQKSMYSTNIIPGTQALQLKVK